MSVANRAGGRVISVGSDSTGTVAETCAEAGEVSPVD